MALITTEKTYKSKLKPKEVSCKKNYSYMCVHIIALNSPDNLPY